MTRKKVLRRSSKNARRSFRESRTMGATWKFEMKLAAAGGNGEEGDENDRRQHIFRIEGRGSVELHCRTERCNNLVRFRRRRRQSRAARGRAVENWTEDPASAPCGRALSLP